MSDILYLHASIRVVLVLSKVPNCSRLAMSTTPMSIHGTGGIHYCVLFVLLSQNTDGVEGRDVGGHCDKMAKYSGSDQNLVGLHFLLLTWKSRFSINRVGENPDPHP